jgi:hypothetical protein
VRKVLIFSFFAFFFSSCRKEVDSNSLPDELNASIAVKWADMTLYVLKNSNFNTPTYSSRSLAYMGICMYESVELFDLEYNSLNNQLNGLNGLPEFASTKEYNPVIVLNQGQRTLLKLLYPSGLNLSSANSNKIDDLAKSIEQAEVNNTDMLKLAMSKQLGNRIANIIFEWSKVDGGFEGFKRNFDNSYQIPVNPGFWTPPVRGQSPSRLPLHPYWGNNRLFIAANNSPATPQTHPYSTDTSSLYFKDYKEVYFKGIILTNNEKEVAGWWGDDPSETFSPPGHSYNLMTISVKKSNCSLMTAAEGYAKVGMAVGDAFIKCWKSKYYNFNERPSTFIKQNINPNWEPFWPEPPFPAFPSGHATQAAAAATVMTSVFGNNFSFTDNSHTNRIVQGIMYKSRNFSNFWAFADECAHSRLLGGIHTRQDNEAGLTIGKLIGNNINDLKWK